MSSNKFCKHNNRPIVNKCFVCGRNCCYECGIDHAISEKTVSYTNIDKSVRRDFRVFCPVCYINYTENKLPGLVYRPRLKDVQSYYSANKLKLLGIGVPFLMLLLAESIHDSVFNSQGPATAGLVILSIFLGIFLVFKGFRNSKSVDTSIDLRIDNIIRLASGLD